MQAIQVRAYFKYFDPSFQKFSAPNLKRFTVECCLCNPGLMQGLQIIRAVLMMSCKDYPPPLIRPPLLVSCSFAIPPPIKSFPGCCSSFPGLRLARPCPDFTRTHPSRSHAHVSSEFRQTFSSPFYNNQPAIRFSPPS